MWRDIDGDQLLCCNLVNGLRVQNKRMHEQFYVIQLLIEADVIEVLPPNHISNKSEGVGLDNSDLIY